MKIIVFFLFVVFHFGYNLKAQEIIPVESISSYVHKIDTFNRYYPHEKIYLHFDNTSYFLGDTVWFKAHLVNAARHIPDNWSRTLYVELLTQEGDIITTKKYKTTDGQCHGFLALRDTLWPGYYEVRAYTRWMLNFGSGHEYTRVFPVFNKPRREGQYSRVMSRRSFDVPDYRKKDPRKWEGKGDKITVDFFPEGGHLVQGLPSRVAFKTVARDSGNLKVSGRVYDASGNDVAYLSTVHDGMGVFEYTPGGGVYTAEFEVDGKAYKFPLPMTETEGCTFRPDIFDPATLKLSVCRSPRWQTETLGITVMCRGQVYYAAELPPSSQENTMVTFPLKGIPTGVSQVTIFDTSGTVLAERLVFVNQHDALQISVSQDKTSYAPFGKVNLDIDIKAPGNVPVSTGFSLAVRDAAQSTASSDADILSYLLLASEIRGYVHNPAYYFEAESRERKYALDLLLMTQGWSRYVWKQLAGVEPFTVSQPAEENISMDGVVLEYSRKLKPVKNAQVMMWMLGSGESYREKSTTDANGNFVFAFDFWGERKLSLEVKENGKRKNCDIRLNRFFAPPLRRLSYYEKQLPVENLIKQQVDIKDTTTIYRPGLSDKEKGRATGDVAKNYTLEEVKVKRQKLYRPEDEGLQRASVAYNLAPLLDKMKDQGNNKAVDLFEFLAQTNPYYHTERPIDPTRDRYQNRPVRYVINNAANYTIPVEELILDRIKLITIDETPGIVCYYIDCTTVTPKIRESVVIHLYTDNNLRTSPIGIRTTQMAGYALVKEFYNPRYDRAILPGETDYCRTLYWNPDVRTDVQGHARVSFYNNGTCQQMNISAQALTPNGQIGTTGL